MVMILLRHIVFVQVKKGQDHLKLGKIYPIWQVYLVIQRVQNDLVGPHKMQILGINT